MYTASEGPVCPPTGNGPGDELWETKWRDLRTIYRLKAQKADNFEYLCSMNKTTLLKICNVQGQCCFQSTGPKVWFSWRIIARCCYVWIIKLYVMANWCWKAVINASKESRVLIPIDDFFLCVWLLKCILRAGSHWEYTRKLEREAIRREVWWIL